MGRTMTDRRFVLGSAIPSGWSVKTALANRGERPDRIAEKSLFKNKLLIGPGAKIHPNDWPILEQGNRGTCNAFAISAAEELIDATQTGSLSDLSEEFIYTHMRKDPIKPLGQIGVDISTIDEEEILESGGTFLYSGLSALEDHGICEERFAAYNKDKKPGNYTVPHFSESAIVNARLRCRSKELFEHDITREPSTGDGRFWVCKGTGVSISSLFSQKIQRGFPVVAAFAILSGIGKQAWFSDQAVRRGVVRYPSDFNASNLKPIGGHTVCLIGVIGDNSAENNPGSFLFRNSHGTDGFAALARKDGLSRFEPAPGYGVISARDVDRYCWEYLTSSNARPRHLPE